MDEDDDDDEEDEEEDNNPERIDPKAILPPGQRRSARGKKIDYTSTEALERAGLQLPGGEDVEMK